MSPSPPHRALQFLRWFCREDYLEEVEGDLIEVFENQYERSPGKARRKFIWNVVRYFRPEFIKVFKICQNSTQYDMLRNYFKISYRNLSKNKGYSVINIGGLAIGMAVAMIIGLWVHDELSYDKYHKNYEDIAQIMYQQTTNNEVFTSVSMARPLEFILRDEFGDDFEHIVMSSWPRERVLSYDEITIKQRGNYMQEGAPSMLSLDIVAGIMDGLNEPNQIMLSKSTAEAIFGLENPVGKMIRMDNNHDLLVTAVYNDLPPNTSFRKLQFIVPWSLYVNTNEYVRSIENVWDHSFQTFVQLVENSDMQGVSNKIKNIPAERDEHLAEYKTELFLHPMKDWHLRDNWLNGVQTGGRMQYVILFSMIGVFVLLLACINFMNLSTARSQKRAKEVGIRKSIGSYRGQLIGQFLNESLIVVSAAFVLALATILLLLPQFNSLMSKQIVFPWGSGTFWTISTGFIITTGLLAGSYPAFYLSSFKPIEALKGTLKPGSKASYSRKILVVLQFTVSITLIISTLLIFRQIQFTKKRPVGYEREGLVQISADLTDFEDKYDMFRNAFIASGAVLEMSASHSPMTDVWSGSSGFSWEGMPADFKSSFATIRVSHHYGNSISWNIIEGRDFSREFSTDSSAVIINQKALEYMGLEEPLGKTIRMGGDELWTIIGVVEDVVMESPYQPVEQTLYTINRGDYNFYTLRLNPQISVSENLSTIEATFKGIMPEIPFTYKFVDESYAAKFRGEERIGTLSWVFTVLAIFISCLGLFGLSSFMAEQRSKEIGIRKVLGATVVNLWQLLIKDFLLLVVIACVVSIPVAYFFMSDWIQQFAYRTNISWWVMLIAGVTAMFITLCTVSYQTIKAASVSPVNSLKDE